VGKGQGMEESIRLCDVRGVFDKEGNSMEFLESGGRR